MQWRLPEGGRGCLLEAEIDLHSHKIRKLSIVQRASPLRREFRHLEAFGTTRSPEVFKIETEPTSSTDDRTRLNNYE